MAQDDNTKNKRTPNKSATFEAYVVDENGNEVPITEDMMEESFAKIKLQSIGAHTGYTKAITDDMLPSNSESD